jgi:hypothetical protein
VVYSIQEIRKLLSSQPDDMKRWLTTPRLFSLLQYLVQAQTPIGGSDPNIRGCIGVNTLQCVCVYYCRTYYKAVCGGGGGQ